MFKQYKVKHIKTPIAMDGWGDINDADGVLIIEVLGDWIARTPELITAINAYDVLVAACKAAAAYLMQDDSFGYGDAEWDAVQDKLRAALARVEESQCPSS